jgi:YggT family protein
MIIIYRIINLLFNLVILLVIADSLVSFFLPPWNQVRSFLDRLVQPLLAPIRRIVPPIGGLDLSPLVLLLVIYILRSVIFSLL